MNGNQIISLKQEVEKTFGQKVLSSSDCYLLSKAIQKKTRVKLSFNTLRRFFNLMSNPYTSSKTTLDVFVSFCGFTSKDDFIHYNETRRRSGKENGHRNLLDYLVYVFKEVRLKNINDKTFGCFVRETIDFLKRYPGLMNRFQQEIAKTYNGQKIYFEKFVHIDKLNAYYGAGLHYYLRECPSKDAQVFGHYLLCFKSWLNMDNEQVIRHCSEAEKHVAELKQHHLANSWHFAMQLFRADVSDNQKEAVLIRAREYYSGNKASKSKEKSSPFFEFYYSNALILTGQYEEAICYIEEALQKKKNSFLHAINLDVFESLRLYKAVSLMHLGDIKSTKEILGSINPESFSFLHKQYMTCLYFLLKQQLNKSHSEQLQINYLIKETGFRRLLHGFCKHS